MIIYNNYDFYCNFAAVCKKVVCVVILSHISYKVDKTLNSIAFLKVQETK